MQSRGTLYVGGITLVGLQERVEVPINCQCSKTGTRPGALVSGRRRARAGLVGYSDPGVLVQKGIEAIILE